jgi:hypothetical protein
VDVLRILNNQNAFMEPCESYVVHGLNLQKLAYSFFYRLQSLDRRLVDVRLLQETYEQEQKYLQYLADTVLSDVDKEPFEYSSEEYQIENDDD